MSRKDQCKAILTRLFGPATAAQVDKMSDDDCVKKCRDITASFLGEEKAKEFDKI